MYEYLVQGMYDVIVRCIYVCTLYTSYLCARARTCECIYNFSVYCSRSMHQKMHEKITLLCRAQCPSLPVLSSPVVSSPGLLNALQCLREHATGKPDGPTKWRPRSQESSAQKRLRITSLDLGLKWRSAASGSGIFAAARACREQGSGG